MKTRMVITDHLHGWGGKPGKLRGKAFNVKKTSRPAHQNPVAVLACRRFDHIPLS